MLTSAPAKVSTIKRQERTRPRQRPRTTGSELKEGHGPIGRQAISTQLVPIRHKVRWSVPHLDSTCPIFEHEGRAQALVHDGPFEGISLDRDCIVLTFGV